ncbi:cytochrome P450 [Sistotremastrum niveocremeum HHB9708]|uniref:Cytochrome P450 n=1 Tax=Sistotremastrum niveocremeum HHB9708 TaxID=1314777 RepID=A0A164S4X6_9AGAM|nr:cytochrome P450 [Sistotremastrum niveocremeum HHB9708]
MSLNKLLPPALLGILCHLIIKRNEPRRLTSNLVLGCLVLPLIVARSTNPRDIVFSYIVLYSTWISSVVLYRLSPLHPLARFPGPVLAKVSKLWGVWVSSRGHQHLVLKSLHDKHGPIVRIGPNELSICDSDAVLSVLGAEGLPKGTYYDARQDPTAPRNLIVLRGEEHAQRRKLWNRGMSSESLLEYAEVISKRALQLSEKLEAAGDQVDLAAWIGYFSFDFMGDMAFGGGFEMLRDRGDKDGLWEVMDSFTYAAALVSHVPWGALAIQRLSWVAKPLLALRKFGVDCATKRIKQGATKKDLWYHLTAEAGLEKTRPLVPNVIAEGALAIIAGSDTAATALCALMYLLLTHPDALKRAREEIDSVYPPGSNALDTRLHDQLHFLQSCTSEALRLHPPVPTNGPRIVPLGSKGKVIAGQFIPEGTQIYVPPYCLHRDPRYFSPSPDQFIPERWFKEGAADNLAFIPFSYGPANCVGRNLARQEILMVTSLLLQQFDIEIAEKEDFVPSVFEDALHDQFVCSRGKLRVRLSKRS